LRSFLYIYRAKSITGAARASGLQQSTLSRHLSELEAQLGISLFTRGRQLTGTNAASIVAEYACQMEAASKQLASALAAGSSEESGTVRVAVTQTAATCLMPPIVASLLQRFPGLQLELIATEAEPRLLEQEVDIALQIRRPRQQEVITRRVADVRIAAIAHRSYLERAGTPQQPADLLHHKLLGLDVDPIMITGLRKVGVMVEKSSFSLRTNDKSGYYLALEAGAGIGFLVDYVLDGNSNLRRVLPELALPQFPLWLSTHSAIGHHRLIRLVYDELARLISVRLSYSGYSAQQ
jgi:DNA-binding transcriptional LysR family regulator